MINYLRSILFSNNDRDPAFVKLFQTVLTFATVAFIGIGLTLAIPLPTDVAGWVSIGVVLTIALLSGLSLYLSHRNILWLGKLLLPLAGLATVIFIAIRADGMHDTAIVGFPLVIVITSLITGQKAIPLATLFTLLGVWTLAFADITGINQSPLAHNTGIADIANTSILLVLAASSLNALMNILNSSVVKAQSNEQAQIAANQELLQLQSVLEKRITDRTRNLELAAEIGRSVSQVGDLDVMLRDAAEIIRSRFDLYYVQVYLVDAVRSALVLQSGTGTVGTALVARGHRLPLNAASINGRAAVEKRPILVEDTTSSASFRPNPLLPDTRSEMAIPLLISDQVVGVLDLQTTQAGYLSHDVLPAFEALAGQLAIAIQNANLLAEADQAHAAVETQARRLVRTSWHEYLDAIHKPETLGFVYKQNQVIPLENEESSTQSANALTAPIAITGEQLGTLAVDIEEANRTTNNIELVNIVAHQVAQQIENLRLLESAERYRYEAEQAASRLTRTGWEDYREAMAGEAIGFRYNMNEVRPLNAQPDPLTEKPAMALPLKVGDETVGKIAVTGLDMNDREAVLLAQSVTDRLGERIESLRQFEQTQSALAQSEKLFDASRQLTQATNLQELVSAAVLSLNIPAINRAVLAAINYGPANQPEGLSVAANWWNGTGAEPIVVGTRYSNGLSLFTTPEPLFLNDILQAERIDSTTLAAFKKQNIRALAILPLFLGTRQIGVLLLEAEETHSFKQNETRLFSALAPQITTVWENRRQFERAQNQAAREATLNAINQKIQSATTVDAVLQIAARELGHALGAPRTIAQLSLRDSK